MVFGPDTSKTYIYTYQEDMKNFMKDKWIEKVFLQKNIFEEFLCVLIMIGWNMNKDLVERFMILPSTIELACESRESYRNYQWLR
jgi:hypothetical protein